MLADNATNALVTLFKTLRKHWALVLACALVCAGAGLLYSKSSAKIFQASTLLEIDPHANQPLGEKTSDVLDMGTGNYWDTRDYYETQYKIVTSDRVLGAVVRDLALVSDHDFMGRGQAPSKTSDRRRRHGRSPPTCDR